MIDYHCHILPGIDDGCKSMEESLLMAQQLAQAGFSKVHCTPHCITGLYDIPPETVRAAVEELQAAVNARGIPLLFEPGMEYYLDDFFLERLNDPLPLGRSNLLLFELPSCGDADMLPEVVSGIVEHGLVPVLAHPERFFMLKKPRRLMDFILKNIKSAESVKTSDQALPPSLIQALGLGCFLQADIGSFNGIYGDSARTTAFILKAAGLYAYYGTDGHGPVQMENVLSENLVLCSGISGIGEYNHA